MPIQVTFNGTVFSTEENGPLLTKKHMIEGVPEHDFEPLTMITKDGYGSDIQLLKFKRNHLLGAVLTPQKNLRFIGSDRIKSALRPDDASDLIISTLSQSVDKAWDIAFNDIKNTYHIWPRLKAAAKNRDNFVVAKSINPFSGCTVEQCEKILGDHGYIRKGVAPNGNQSWVNQNNGRKAYVDLGKDSAAGAGTSYSEPPHIDISYLNRREHRVPILDSKGNLQTDTQGEILVRQRIIEKRKFPLSPGDKRWDPMIAKCQESTRRTEILRGRSGVTNNLQPTLTKGGTELYVSVLKGLPLERNYKLLIPRLLGPEQITTDEVNRMIRELFVGWIINNEVPSVSMDSNPDHSIDLALPATYQGTFVGEIYKEMDAAGKAVMMGTHFPPQARFELWQTLDTLRGDRSDLSFLKDYATENILKLYQDHGVENLDAPFLMGLKAHEEALTGLHETYGSSSAIFTFISHIAHVSEYKGYLHADVSFDVIGTLHFKKAVSENAQKSADDAMGACARLIKEQMIDSGRHEKTIELFKLSAVILSMMHTLYENYRILPNLSDLPAAPVMYLHEDKMPPYIRGDAAEGCLQPIHGEARVGYAEVEVESIVDSDQDLLDASEKEFSGLVELGGKSFNIHSVPYARYDKGPDGPTWFHNMVKDATSRREMANKKIAADESQAKRESIECHIAKLNTFVTSDSLFYEYIKAACETNSLRTYFACKDLWVRRSITGYSARKSWQTLLNEPFLETEDHGAVLHPSRSWWRSSAFQSLKALPMALAAEHADRTFLQALLADGADVNPSEWSSGGLLRVNLTYPLAASLNAGKKENVQFLRDHGAVEENPFIFFEAHGNYMHRTGDKTYQPIMLRLLDQIKQQEFKSYGNSGYGVSLITAAALSFIPKVFKSLIDAGIQFRNHEAVGCLKIWFQADLTDEVRASLIESMGLAFWNRFHSKVSLNSILDKSLLDSIGQTDKRGEHRTVQAMESWSTLPH